MNPAIAGQSTVPDPAAQKQIAQQLGLPADSRWQAVGGGDIALAYRVCGPVDIFVKWMDRKTTDRGGSAHLLEQEARNLAAIERTAAIKVPAVLGTGLVADGQWLALEYLALRPRSADADAGLGRQLASMHRHTGENYGWPTDNFIGSTVQYNQCGDRWAAFFAERRIRPQWQWLADRGAGLSVGCQSLLEAVYRRLEDHQPPASLLHGDLWSGNAAMTDDGEPVVFDPACYFGDRETDLAMTRLFGGFDPAFYRAYESAWPLPAGAAVREPVYRLYHLLNHANLFGGHYLAAADRLAGSLIPNRKR